MRRLIAEEQRAALPPEIVVAQAQGEVEAYPYNPLFVECEDEGGVVVVTGSRVASSPQSSSMVVTSITNNQTANVDEGYIVKLIGDYLLVLQDGRIFAADYHTMQLTDRIDVYRRDEVGDPIGADWNDCALTPKATLRTFPTSNPLRKGTAWRRVTSARFPASTGTAMPVRSSLAAASLR